jgi:uncharacterized membrane protein YkoI
LLVATQAALAKDISFNDLSPAAQREAQTELKSGTLKKVESVKYQGRDIYALTFQRADGSPKYIYLNPDGTYVHDQSLAKASSGSPASAGVATAGAAGKEVPLTQVPEAVQRTIKTETHSGPLSRIMQQPHNGGLMYEAFFRLPNGQEKAIYLNPDGSYVQEGARTARSWDVLGNSTVAPRAATPQQLSFSQLPAAVQNAFRTEAGASRIQNIRSTQVNGQTVYEAEINRNGQRQQVRVNAAGTVLNSGAAQSTVGTTRP